MRREALLSKYLGSIAVVASHTKRNWLLVVALALAVVVRPLLIPAVVGGDYREFLKPWYKEIVENGRLASLGMEISNYSPPYMYLLTLATLLPVKPLVAIKSIPIVFDVLAAIAVFKITRVYHPDGGVPVVASGCFLLCPTVIMNGTMWGQCDIVYSTFLLVALYASLVERPLLSVLSFSVAASVKLQALFFVPALGVIFIARGWSLLYFLLTPLAYLVFALPPVVLGRPAEEVLSIYTRQFSEYEDLARNAASVYQWIPETRRRMDQIHGGIAYTAAACAMAGYVLLNLSSKRLGRADLLNSALFMAAIPPFLLPKMHERYAFMTDVLACIVPFVTPQLTISALLLIGASFASYSAYIGPDWLPLPFASLLNLSALFLIGRHLAHDLGIGAALTARRERVVREATASEPEESSSSERTLTAASGQN